MMKYAVVLIFIIVYLGFNSGYYTDGPLVNHIIFNFSHTNWIHLTINSLAYISVFRMLEKTIRGWYIILFSLLIASLSSFYAIYDIPTMGASGMIYAMIGMWFSLVINKELIIVEKYIFKLYVFSVFFSLFVSYFNQHSNFKLHILCLVAGLISSLNRFGTHRSLFMS